MKEIQIGANDFKDNKVPLYAKKSGKMNNSMSAAPKLAVVPASRYYCDLKKAILQCMCRVSLGLKEVQVGANDFKYNKVRLFARRQWNINTSMSAAPKLALVPASCYYRDVTWSYHNVCAKFN